jgi:hypothetical protein
MMHEIIQNGYETPRSPRNGSIFDNVINDKAEGRRTVFGSSDNTEQGSEEHIQAQRDLEAQNQSDHEREAEIHARKVGIRARIGCYTWSASIHSPITTRLLIRTKDILYPYDGNRWDCECSPHKYSMYLVPGWCNSDKWQFHIDRNGSELSE